MISVFQKQKQFQKSDHEISKDIEHNDQKQEDCKKRKKDTKKHSHEVRQKRNRYRWPLRLSERNQGLQTRKYHTTKCRCAEKASGGQGNRTVAGRPAGHRDECNSTLLPGKLTDNCVKERSHFL